MKLLRSNITSDTPGAELVGELQRRIELVECPKVFNEYAQCRRQFIRYKPAKSEIPVTATLPGKPVYKCSLGDISFLGARLYSDEVPNMDDCVELCFDLGENSLHINGIVRHAGTDGDRFYFGVEFQNPGCSPDKEPGQHDSL